MNEDGDGIESKVGALESQFEDLLQEITALRSQLEQNATAGDLKRWELEYAVKQVEAKVDASDLNKPAPLELETHEEREIPDSEITTPTTLSLEKTASIGDWHLYDFDDAASSGIVDSDNLGTDTGESLLLARYKDADKSTLKYVEGIKHDLDDSNYHDGITGTEDNFMALDSSGLPKDSGSKASDFATPGDLHDRQHNLNSTDDHVGTVAPSDAANFMGFDASNLPADSGSKAADFAEAAHDHDDRYYTETELDAGQLDNRYFTETEHINTSAGATDADKPIKLDAEGHIDATMLNDADIDHDNLSNVSSDQHHARKHDLDGGDDHTAFDPINEDNFMGINASGLPKDSGSKASDFATAGHGHDQLHDRKHDLDSTDDHNGISGDTGDIMVLNSDGLPVSSGYTIAELIAAAMNWELRQTWEGGTCRPVCDEGKQWYVGSVTKDGDDWVADMQQRCVRSDDEPGYCPSNATVVFSDGAGGTVEVTLVDGVLVGYTGTMEGINPADGSAVTLTIVDGLSTSAYEGEITVTDPSTYGPIYLRVNADGTFSG